MSDSSLLSQPDNVSPMPSHEVPVAGAASMGVAASSRLSGLDVAVVALLVSALVGAIGYRMVFLYQNMFWSESSLWEFVFDSLFNNLLWVIVVAVAMSVKRRGQVGVLASLVAAVPWVVGYPGTFQSTVWGVLCILLPIVVALALSFGSAHIKRRWLPLGVVFAEGLAIVGVVDGFTGLLYLFYGIAGYPGHPSSDALISYGADLTDGGVFDVVRLLLGVLVLVLVSRRRWYVVFAVLVVAQVIIYVFEYVSWYRDEISPLVVVAAAVVVWTRSVRRWFSATWNPSDVPMGHAPVVVPMGMAVTVPGVHPQERRVFGSDGHLNMEVPAASSLSESIGAQGSGGDPAPSRDALPADVDVSARVAVMLPSTRTIFWISFFFGLFGLIPMMMGNSMARNLGVVTNSYNREFLKGWLIGMAVWGG
ncbi:hypothetical protein [Actinomyces sp.]|uniref:hypothetical protein n=1 Tax=Actinomyces sp. TaxID=29317 RepID=UPI0026DB31E0|nr:hypothetical protein [Actinomyces sp.]MDO4654516.1 hypothetical protein [Actinomyces sp.]